MAGSGRPPDRSPGRPTSPEGADLYLGVDLGATKLATALLDAGGGIVATHRSVVPPGARPTEVVAEIGRHALVGLKTEPARIRAVGVGVAAQVRPRTGEVHFAPNLAWRDVPLREMLEATLDRPTLVTNDVRAATYGEWTHGGGQGAADLACLWLGTGVGGAAVVDGRLLDGATNTAGEVGHLTIVYGGRRCRCRGVGCLEAYVGGWAIAERARERVERSPEAGRVLLRLAGGRAEHVVGRHVADAYHAGDPLARALVHETAEYLGAGLTSIVNAFDPSLVLLGGGVVDGIPELPGLAEAFVRAHALDAALDGLTFGLARLGGDAGSVGAAALARDRLRE